MNEHRKFLKQKGAEGRLILAGRFTDMTGSLLVWSVSSIDEARKIATADPYYLNGITTFILKQWNLTWNFMINPPLQPSI